MPPVRKVTASYSVEILLPVTQPSCYKDVIPSRDNASEMTLSAKMGLAKCGLTQRPTAPLSCFSMFTLASLKLVSMMLVNLPRDRKSAEAAPYMDVVVYVGTRRKIVEHHEQKLKLLDLHLVLPLGTIKAPV
jgi:hypothetical protein